MSGSRAPEALPIAAGDVLVGRYRVESILGVGGMGIVVAATQLDLDRRVAIKVLLPSALESNGARERFAREGRALSRLTTDHVTRVLEVGELESGLPFLVMEFLEGTDLSALLTERGTFDVPTVVDLVTQVCAGLADAHDNGIIHRDLKPSNLFLASSLGGSKSLKILDFGISKVLGPQSKVVTCDSEVLGSPLYMSPEQLCSTRHLDERSDIWALGVVMYELLVGCVPFDGDNFTEICARILHAPTPRIDTVRRDVPKGFADVVARCLAKDRNRRFRNVGELANALAPYAQATIDERARTTARRRRVLPKPNAMRMIAAVLGVASLTGLISVALQEEGTLPTREHHQVEVVSVKSAFIVTTADTVPSRTLDVVIDAKAPAPYRPVRTARVSEPDLGY